VLTIQPVTFSEACQFIKRHHRHHRPPVGSVFQIAANDGEAIVGVIVVGRPVARMLDNGLTVEVTRCCTDGTRNACSFLYGAAWKAAKSLGWSKMVTYTLPDEGGASLRATGAMPTNDVGGGVWVHSGRRRTNDHPLGKKIRWEWICTERRRFRLHSEVQCHPCLFSQPPEESK
jgi:hypothetical protein